jgi:peptide/nickel transport system substrate-binding protein
MKLKTRVLAAAALIAAAAIAQAQTARIANQGESAVDGPALAQRVLAAVRDGNVYEALVGRNKDLSVAPALATSWKQTSPNVWRFELRKDVQFHDGKPFTADDVLFSFTRTQAEGSDMKSYTNDCKEVRKVNDTPVEIETKSPFPILPDVISLVYIMSKKWCEENQATRPVDRRKGIENAAVLPRERHRARSACASASPTCAPTFVRNGNYWGKIDGNVRK